MFGNEVNSICQLVKAPNALEKSYLEWNQFSNQNIIKEKGCFDHYSIWEQILSLRNKIVDLASGGNLIIEKHRLLWQLILIRQKITRCLLR